MPIEPVKPTNLADVWNPMQSLGPAVQLQQIGLQQQQLDVQGQRIQVEALEAVAKNPDVNPIERYRSVSRLLEMGGVKTDPGEFMALPNLWTNTALSMVENGPDAPETLRLGSELLQKSPLFRSQFEAHQKMARQAQNVKGLQSLGSQAAGRNLSMAEAEASAQSPNIQKQVAETVFQGPLEQARTRQINDNVDALKVREGQLSTMQQQLVAYANPTFIDLNTESAYRQTIGMGGDTKAGSVLESVKMENDDLAINTGTLTRAERAEAGQRVEQEITALRTKQRELQGNIRKARDLAGTAGAIDPTTYESELQAVTAALNVKLAEKPYLKSFAQPDFDRLQAAYGTYTNLVQSNKDQILAVRNAAIGLRSASLDEKSYEFDVKQQNERNLASAQREYLETKDLAAVLKKYPTVRADQVKEAEKDPNRALVNVQTGVPASEEAQKEFMKSARTTYDQLKNAPSQLKNIEEAKALIPKAKGFMGPGGETLMEAAKFLNNRAGFAINTEGIKSAEELRSRIFFNIMDNLKKMDAQPSQLQQQIMMDSLGKLGTDPNALVVVLNAYEDTIRNKVELHNEEVRGAVKEGVKFPYDPTIKLPKKAQKAAAAQKGPSVGTVEDGYRFKGGDPTKQENWEKVK